MTATETEYDFSGMSEALPSETIPQDYDPPRESDA